MASSDQIADLYGSVRFRVDQQSVKHIFSALDRIKIAVRGIEKQFAGVGISKKFADNFKNVSREALKVSTSLDEVNKKAGSGVNPINDYARAIGGLAMQMGALRTNLVGGVRLPRVPGSSVGGGSGGGNAPSSSMGFLSGLIGGPGSFARGIVPGLGAGWLVRQSVLDYRSMLGTEYAMQSITGSPEAGATEMAYLKKFSNQYGFDMQSSGQQYKGILAAARGTKLQGAAARNIFEGIQLQGAALGLDSEKMKRATTAIQQMIGKGKIMAEELKGQLAEALPDAVQVFAKAQGVTVAQMFKMMENGEVLAEDVLPKVAEIYKEMAKSGGGLDQYMASSLAAQNRFFNSLRELMVLLAKSGLDRMLAGVFNTLTGIVDALKWVLSPDSWSVWATAGVMAAGFLISRFKLIAIIMQGIWDTAIVSNFVKKSLYFMTVLARGMFLRFLPIFLLMDMIDAQANGKRSIVGDAFRNIFGMPAPISEAEIERQRNPTKADVLSGKNAQPRAGTLTPEQKAKLDARLREWRESKKNTNQNSSIMINIHGVTDPQAVASAVDSRLKHVFNTAISDTNSVVFVS